MRRHLVKVLGRIPGVSDLLASAVQRSRRPLALPVLPSLAPERLNIS
jgi:hypothetical protein